MDHTHQYDCIVCGEHFDNSQDLAAHNDEAHLSSATGMERPRKAHGDVLEGHVGRERPAPDHEQDRNPRQGFVDPRSDASRNT